MFILMTHPVEMTDVAWDEALTVYAVPWDWAETGEWHSERQGWVHGYYSPLPDPHSSLHVDQRR